MSFKETIVYTAECDICGGLYEDDDTGECGWPSPKQALEHASDWITDDQGRLVCTGCWPCSRCGAKGGRKDHGVFLCDLCWNQACRCGHPRRWHEPDDELTVHSAVWCHGFNSATNTFEVCDCTEFATEQQPADPNQLALEAGDHR